MSLAAAIRQCYEGRTTQVELAAKLAKNQSTISKWVRGENEPTLEEIASLERACDRPAGWILIAGGFVDVPSTTSDAINQDPSISDTLRELLMEQYRSAVKLSRR